MQFHTVRQITSAHVFLSLHTLIRHLIGPPSSHGSSSSVSYQPNYPGRRKEGEFSSCIFAEGSLITCGHLGGLIENQKGGL
jgi:hypothetical protein